ncbi:MAG: hypothetical protein M1821_008296 [Bathelium mastoideum]|nr:MAG: hypothetical protein M1821_008296 [Bathelium mastoideum]
MRETMSPPSPSPLSARVAPSQRYAPLPGFAVNPIVYNADVHRRWRVGRTRDEMNAIRTGVQVHAVPENERAYDSAGRRLPWGYTYADSDRRYPEEKGPFGKSTSLRGLSRSRTYTPARKEDQAKLDNQRATDDVFNKWKAGLKEKNKSSEDSRDDALAVIDPGLASNPPATTIIKEPSEVILYGFGSETQWAAIAFYEEASQGMIYEDYERTAPSTRFDHTFANTASRAASLSRLSQAALRKKNTWVGGEHWIKVTFDSPESAENACRVSPHNICGYRVYAERYRGIGPDQDVPIFATIAGEVSPPNSQSTHTMSGALPDSPESSTTASSATATAPASSALNAEPSGAAPAPSSDRVAYPNLRRSVSARRRHPLMQTQNADDLIPPDLLRSSAQSSRDTFPFYPGETPSSKNMPPHTRRRLQPDYVPSPPPLADVGFTNTFEAGASRPPSGDAAGHLNPSSSPPSSTPTPAGPSATPATSSAAAPHTATGLRIRHARTLRLAPATSAVLPAQPEWKLFLAALPLLGVLFTVLLGVPPDATTGPGAGGVGGGGGGLDVIGSQVPRREDGAFDWEGASVWWRVCWWLDHWLWTDLCGMKGED